MSPLFLMARAKQLRTSNTIPPEIRPRVIQVMDSLGGDDFAYFNIDPKSIKIGSDRAKIKFYMKVLVNSSSREVATNSVAGELTKRRVGYTVNGNQINIQVNEGDANDIIRLDIKPHGGGSGGGSDVTAKAESGQALFAALRWSRSTDFAPDELISEADLDSVLANCSIHGTGKNMTVNTVLQVDTQWIRSHKMGANLLYNKYSSKNYQFHRGSPEVKKIEAAWKKCNIANNRYFSDINKWNPADIWLMTNEFVANQLSTLEEATTLETLNAKLQKYYDSGDCIGVSLKQITQGTGNWDLINNQGSLKDIDKVQFRGIHGTYDSIDFYIKWGVGGKDDIQFRNTAGDKKLQWQGEIKGVSAAQGKVGGGILDGILDKLGHTMIGVKNQHQRLKNATNPNSRQHAQGMSKTIYDKAKVHKLSGFKDDVNLISEIANESHSWRYSNYINYKLLDLVKSMSEEQKHKFVQAVYFYAASQSDLSSIHAKIK